MWNACQIDSIWSFQDNIMGESVEEAEKHEEILRVYHSAKEALRIIGDVSMATVSTPFLSPFKNFLRSG